MSSSSSSNSTSVLASASPDLVLSIIITSIILTVLYYLIDGAYQRLYLNEQRADITTNGVDPGVPGYELPPPYDEDNQPPPYYGLPPRYTTRTEEQAYWLRGAGGRFVDDTEP